MRKLMLACLALIAVSCADKGTRKTTENEPVNVGVMTVTPMCAQYYNVYVGEINASGSAVISSNHSGILEAINAIKARSTYAQEDWLIIITSDHGGIETNHGNESIQERMTFVVMNKEW